MTWILLLGIVVSIVISAIVLFEYLEKEGRIPEPTYIMIDIPKEDSRGSADPPPPYEELPLVSITDVTKEQKTIIDNLSKTGYAVTSRDVANIIGGVPDYSYTVSSLSKEELASAYKVRR